MAKYQIKAALLAPSGNYDKTTDPKAVADFKALDKAYDTYLWHTWTLLER